MLDLDGSLKSKGEVVMGILRGEGKRLDISNDGSVLVVRFRLEANLWAFFCVYASND